MLSVIVLSKNNGDTLRECLQSIVKAPPFDKEVVVIDAKSTDNTSQILAEFRDKIRILYDEGKGIGIARNIGVKNCKNDIIAFVDADAVCSKNHFQKILDCLESNPEVGVINVEGAIIEGDTFIEQMQQKVRGARRMVLTKIERTKIAGGCFMAFRKKVFEEVNGFWEFPPYGADDLDFSLKVRVKGWKMGLVKVKSWHRPRETLMALLREMWGWGKGKACLVKKWGTHPMVIDDYRNRKMFKLFRSVWLYILFAHLLAPLVALRYVHGTKSLLVYPFYIVNQYAYLFGYIYGWFTWARRM